MLIFAVLLTCFMITVILTDSTRYIIPNWLVLFLLVLYPAMVFLSPARPDWKMACLIGLGTFVVGYVLFIVRALGGGDVKLLAVTALYAGKDGFPQFIMEVAILGGLGSVLLLILRAMTPYVFMKLKKPASSIPRVLTDKEPVPYGVAIGIAFLCMLWQGKIPGVVF